MSSRPHPQSLSLDGDGLRQMMAAGRACLEVNVEAINALNVFPVPDGDTGTNMLLTMKALEEAVAQTNGRNAGEMAQAMARGALMGARGNSGVILSQFFRGLALGLKGTLAFGSQELCQALRLGSQMARKGVSKPVEGTILTVVDRAADWAEAGASPISTPASIWEQACLGAANALQETPSLLPLLKEAGVVDAGGQGLVALLEGARAFLTGEEVSPLEIEAAHATPSAGFLDATQEEAYGYCTQLLLRGQALDEGAVRDHMAAMADSTIVVGDDEALRIHVHTDDPGAILSYAVSMGSLAQVKIDNIDEQHQEFLALHRQRQEIAPLGVVAVAAGRGIERVLRTLGTRALVPGGQTMNPSARELLEGVERANAEAVVLLPNNKNIVAAAQQAASLSSRTVHVVPTLSIPQGIAALLAFNPDRDVTANLRAMQEALQVVWWGEVTTAVRSTTLEGTAIREGQAMALLQERLVAVADTPASALRELLLHTSPAPGGLVTLYWGANTPKAEAEEAGAWAQERFPGVEVEVVFGGQPHYHYLVSVE